MSPDEHIGATVKFYRDARGMSQSGLALQMMTCQLGWSQATVWATEKGSRALKLREAQCLAEVLELSVLDLLPEAEHRIEVFIHAVESETDGIQKARCGKVWRPSSESIALTRCPECVAITEREWSA